MAGLGQWDSYVNSNLIRYRHKEKTYKDAMTVFKSFRDLRPKRDTYTFNDGSLRELLAIEGTIPVFYKGTTYNMPIIIWLMDTHPDNAPLCFIKPTKDMLIKPSKFVDSNGRIYLPYLHDWKYPTSDLVGLLQVMSAVFGETPPVFTKSSQPCGTSQNTDATANATSELRSSFAPIPLPTPRCPPEIPSRLSSDSSKKTSEETLTGDRERRQPLQQEVEELRSRLQALEAKMPEQQQMGQRTTEECNICKRPCDVKFQCGHGACKRCGSLIDHCPECRVAISVINVL